MVKFIEDYIVTFPTGIIVILFLLLYLVWYFKKEIKDIWNRIVLKNVDVLNGSNKSDIIKDIQNRLQLINSNLELLRNSTESQHGSIDKKIDCLNASIICNKDSIRDLLEYINDLKQIIDVISKNITVLDSNIITHSTKSDMSNHNIQSIYEKLNALNSEILKIEVMLTTLLKSDVGF